MNSLDDSRLNLFAKMLINKAKKNVEKRGVQDMMTLGMAAAEEMGELAQAILQHRDEDGDRKRIRDEAIDLGALCIQVLLLYCHLWGAENVMKALFGEEGKT